MFRSRPLMLLTVAVLVLAGCPLASPPPPARSNPCKTNPNGGKDSHAPIICIHDADLASLTAAPDQAHAYKGSTVQWWTVSGTGTLSIDSTTLPVDSVTCEPNRGHCRASIRADAPHATHKYYASVTRAGRVGITPDPTIIIDTQ